MGREIGTTEYTRSQRTRYRQELRRNLDLFESFLDTAEFIDEGTVGVELEMNLAETEGMAPALLVDTVLEDLDDEDFVHEIGRFNLEANLPVTHPTGTGLRDLETELTAKMEQADAAARRHGARVIPIGHLPTITEQLFTGEDWRAPGARYEALENSVMEARGEEINLRIDGEGKGLDTTFDSIAPESACTSMQLHLQVPPEQFAAAWNAAQAIAGPQVALAANSPFLLGKRLWHETRIPTFVQALDTRPPELATQGVRPRVWFGERWITSMFDLFEENVRLFPALIPESRDMAEEPLLTEGSSPRLHELMLHNGTVWRWNRPIYDPSTDVPHLRLENRLLPAGPTAADMAANAAFFYGILHTLVHERRPLWSRMSFEQADESFQQCARWGLEARVRWPKVGRVRVADLLRDQLIPQAMDGLRTLGADAEVTEHYGQILTERTGTGRNGARWQIDTVTSLELRGASRPEALAEMTRLYREGVDSGEPVHAWPVPARQRSRTS
ncbi:glutamate--cysteine ligase [Brachybacterium alimentarium]|uniref:Glutamate--cysteine ligase n=1 Tax=Brachybacterium alimentarium TaxID=47845 RepID=A0A2A3YML0_9MICO|nr:glutamate--cysteine ligase [Brachybacterium alimentarium]PCC40534.1 glutamate--cysteine ligase [Brachybacterium alimentarium]RCS67417.1 glutamate--cysteine ligase [Brachybacterium alimentarium]RCS75808.1 glutamate--cysteine ligase [Brachybacterium alimentarium]